MREYLIIIYLVLVLIDNLSENMRSTINVKLAGKLLVLLYIYISCYEALLWLVYANMEKYHMHMRIKSLLNMFLIHIKQDVKIFY